MNLAANYEQTPSSVSPLDHRTVSSLKPKCIALPECSRCVAFQFPCATGVLIKPLLLLDFDFYVHSFQLYSGVSLSIVSTPLLETPFLAIILPPLCKEL